MAGPARNTFLNVAHTIRKAVQFNTPLLTDGNGNYIELPFQIPAGSVHTSTNVVTAVVFNAGTTNTVSLGKSTATDMMAATATTAVGVVSVAGSGRVGTSDVTVKLYVVASGTAPTTGDVEVIVHYVPQGT